MLIKPTAKAFPTTPLTGTGRRYKSAILSSLITVHGHALRSAAELAISSRADGSAASTSVRAAFLERKQLLGTEGLVVRLRGGLDQVLEMGSEEEVSQVDKFAVVLVLDVNDTPAVLAATDLLAIDHDGLLRADDGKGDKALYQLVKRQSQH